MRVLAALPFVDEPLPRRRTLETRWRSRFSTGTRARSTSESALQSFQQQLACGAACAGALVRRSERLDVLDRRAASCRRRPVRLAEPACGEQQQQHARQRELQRSVSGARAEERTQCGPRPAARSISVVVFIELDDTAGTRCCLRDTREKQRDTTVTQRVVRQRGDVAERNDAAGADTE